MKASDFTAIRNEIAEGLDDDRNDRLRECRTAAASGASAKTNHMAAVAAGAGFMPMLSRSVGRLVLMAEMGWLTTKTSGSKEK